MDIRKLIKETIESVFKEEDSPIGDVIANIESQMQNDQDNLKNILATQKSDVNNKESEISAKNQLKSKLDAKSPQKKGLEREIPESQKELVIRKKQIKDLEDAQKGMSAAQKEIQKQRLDMETQKKASAKPGENKTPSILPSLASPI